MYNEFKKSLMTYNEDNESIVFKNTIARLPLEIEKNKLLITGYPS